MKKILLTGGTGFIGQNIRLSLSEKYQIEAPRREDLNLRDEEALYHYLEKGQFDVVIHSASPVRNKVDSSTPVLEESLRLFMNFYRARELYGKLIYFGSGAEYDKTRDLNRVRETSMGEWIPKDEYGLGKYIMNALAVESKNIYNLRLFACFGPYEHETRLITHAIRCCIDKVPISMRQDCLFDYMHVSDLVKIIEWFILNNPKCHEYNVCSGKPIKLSDIAEFINNRMAGKGISYQLEGYSKAYTGDNSRLLEEIMPLTFMDLQEGIDKQIIWQRGCKHETF